MSMFTTNRFFSHRKSSILSLFNEGGASNTKVFRIVHHINFKALRFRWQKLLLDYLANNLPDYELPNFKKLKNQIL